MSTAGRPNLPDIPENLMCGCGEPVKIIRDRFGTWIGCSRCNTEVHMGDEPAESEWAAGLIKRYWLDHGRPEYAGGATPE